MAWNEPGGGNNRDPWGGGGGGNNQGPPDLDEVFRRIKQRLNGLFGGGGGSGGSGSGGGGPSSGMIIGILAVVVGGWLLSGIYIVDAGEKGLVRLFGAHVATTEPGAHWRWPTPIGAVDRVNVARRRSIEIGSTDRQKASRASEDESVMLTADENLVSVNMEMQYKVDDARAYVYEFQDPDKALRDIGVSALREVVGNRDLSELLAEDDMKATFDQLGQELDITEEDVKDLEKQSSVVAGEGETADDDGETAEDKQQDLVAAIRTLVTEHVAQYGVGLEIAEINVNRARPPQEVQPAFDDAVKAREDMRRFIQAAIKYKKEQVPQARGTAAAKLSDARSYASEKTNTAEGKAQRFVALRDEFRQAPEVTRERLYIEAIQSVLSESDKILVDTEGNSPLMHMPINGVLNRGIDARGGAGPRGDERNGNSSDSSRDSNGVSETDSSSTQVSSDRQSRSDRQRESY